MLKSFCFGLSVFCCCITAAQNNLTFSNDFFSGINSAPWAPTQPFLSSNPWDVNLVAADLFIENDYAYIAKQSLLGLANTTIEVANPKGNNTSVKTANVLDFYNKDKATFFVASDILGPSFSMTANIREKKYVLGLFTRLRTQSSFLDFDNYLRYGNARVFQPSDYKMKPFSTNLMNWNEIGLNASTTIFPYSAKQWILGFNLKYEIGLDAANIANLNDIDLTATQPPVGENPDLKNIYASNYNLHASYTTNYNFETNRMVPVWVWILGLQWWIEILGKRNTIINSLLIYWILVLSISNKASIMFSTTETAFGCKIIRIWKTENLKVRSNI